MRWQKTARLAIAAFVIAFAAVVFVALRRPAAPDVKEDTPRRNPETVVESGAFELTSVRNGKRVVIRGEAQETYPDGRKVARHATITLPDRQGRTITVTGAEMEVLPPETPDDTIGLGRLAGGVTLESSDGLRVTSEEARYDSKSGVLTVPGPVQFVRGRLSGSGVGATYDERRDVLWLLADARVTVEPDPQGGGALDATAGAAGMARAEHYIRLTKPAHLVSEGRTIDTDDLTIQLTPDDRLVQTMALRGNSRIAGAAGASAAEGMTARDIDLAFGPDGRALQQARLMEKAAVQLAGGRRISGRSIDLAFAADGTTVTGLNATQDVEVQLPAAPGAAARRIAAATLTAEGATGIETAAFGGGVVYEETRGGERGAPPAPRTARSLRLSVRTEPGFGEIKEADFRGNVHIEDGATTAEGPRAVYRIAQDTFDVSPSDGDPGPPPSMNDGRVLVNARTISFSAGKKRLRAETDVRSSIQPSKDRNAAAQKGGRLPSMLKEDEPVNVTSHQLDYDGAAGKAVYTGDAKLFQGNTSVLGDVVEVDDRTANLTAKGHVRTVMFFEETDEKTKKTRLVQTDATGDALVYDDAKRLATYTTGPTAMAHVRGTQGDVTADRIDLYLQEGSNELERAEADGQVVVKEGSRTATGRHLTYTPADQTYVMTGTPVEIEERTPEDCRLTVGTSVTFRREAVDTRISGNGSAPVHMTRCTARTR